MGDLGRSCRQWLLPGAGWSAEQAQRGVPAAPSQISAPLSPAWASATVPNPLRTNMPVPFLPALPPAILSQVAQRKKEKQQKKATHEKSSKLKAQDYKVSVFYNRVKTKRKPTQLTRLPRWPAQPLSQVLLAPHNTSVPSKGSFLASLAGFEHPLFFHTKYFFEFFFPFLLFWLNGN